LPGGKKQLVSVSFQKSKEDQWRVRCGDDGSCGIAPFSPNIPSAVELIKEFYSAINSKDPQILEEKLDQLLSDGCEYQDLFFYIPFQGKQVFFPLLYFSMILNAIARPILGQFVACWVRVMSKYSYKTI
jgi:hypothetical protein